MQTSTDALRAQADEHRRAAEAAEAATQWQDAVSEYEACLSLVAQSPESAAQDEAELLTALGRCYWNLSEARTAWRTLRRAIALYRERGDGVGQARATVEILRIWGPPERHRAMAEEALEALGDDDPRLRAILLLRRRWSDADPKETYRQAIALAEAHGLEDILAMRLNENAWLAFEDGRVQDAVAFLNEAHEVYARLRIYEEAAGALRGAAFQLLEAGRLDEGFAFAERSFDYASGVHLHFSIQLPLMDMAGVLFARGDFDRCEAVLARSPGESDFRADLYRMWMAEARGDMEGALRLLVDPERGGRTPTAVGQIHAAAAGVLYRAGRDDAAGQALRAWAEVERRDSEPYWMEGPAVLECLLGLGDDALVRRVYDAFVERDEQNKAPARFSTLQGRALAPLRGGVCARLGLIDEAARHYRDGLDWCERERCARDAELCRTGLERLRA